MIVFAKQSSQLDVQDQVDRWFDPVWFECYKTDICWPVREAKKIGYGVQKIEALLPNNNYLKGYNHS
jgi:hypothetical protein